MLGLAWAAAFLLPLLPFRGDYLDYLWPKHSSWYEGVSVAGCKDITVLLSPVSSGWRCIKIYDDTMGKKKKKHYRRAGILLVTLRLHIGCPGHLNCPHTFIYHDETVSMHLVFCQYAYRGKSGATKQWDALLEDSECALRKAGCRWGGSPLLFRWRDVTWAVWSP